MRAKDRRPTGVVWRRVRAPKRVTHGFQIYLLAGAIAVAGFPVVAHAQAVADQATVASGTDQVAPEAAAGDDKMSDIVVTGTVTRSVTQISGTETQAILTGTSPLKALQTLPTSRI